MAALDSDSMTVLAAGELPSLRRLSMTNGQIGSTGVEALARAPLVRQLEFLSIGWNRVGHRGAAALAAAEAPSLRELVLEHNSVGDRGAAALAAARWAPHVTRLGLAKAQLRDAGAAALCAGRLDALQELDLRDNALSDGARTVVRSRFGARALL
jgi:Ran GTPase-activating protein (RanGAP) involved in mRNA processing and transport